LQGLLNASGASAGAGNGAGLGAVGRGSVSGHGGGGGGASPAPAPQRPSSTVADNPFAGGDEAKKQLGRSFDGAPSTPAPKAADIPAPAAPPPPAATMGPPAKPRVEVQSDSIRVLPRTR